MRRCIPYSSLSTLLLFFALALNVEASRLYDGEVKGAPAPPGCLEHAETVEGGDAMKGKGWCFVLLPGTNHR